MINRVLIIFFICHNCVFGFAQNDQLLPRITGESLESANEVRKDEAYLLSNQIRSDEISSILTGLIPMLVRKERNIRYLWDKRKQRNHGKKPIYVFNRLIEYDSIDFTNICVYDFRIPKSDAINEQIVLCDDCPGKEGFSMHYHRNLPCVDTFPFAFYFVDDIYKADFVLSTIHHNDAEGDASVYVCHIRGFELVESYLLNIELPRFNECYNVRISDTHWVSYRFDMDTLNQLSKIRSDR